MVEDYDKLLDYCIGKNKSSSKAFHLLETNEELDLLKDKGMCFRLTIKYDNPILLNELLKYYYKHKLHNDCDSLEHKIALSKLHKVLEAATSSFKLSVEVKGVLASYLDLGEADEKEQDLSGFDIEEEYVAQDSSYIINKSNSAPELTYSNIAVKMLHSSSESLISSHDSFDDPHYKSFIDLAGQEFPNPNETVF